MKKLNRQTKKMAIQIKTLEIAGLGSVLAALRLPYGKEVRSEFIFHSSTNEDYEKPMLQTESNVHIDERDLKLLSTLIKRGEEHSKCIRGLIVYAEINAPAIGGLRRIRTVLEQSDLRRRVPCTSKGGD